jgi:hypothetical protein
LCEFIGSGSNLVWIHWVGLESCMNSLGWTGILCEFIGLDWSLLWIHWVGLESCVNSLGWTGVFCEFIGLDWSLVWLHGVRLESCTNSLSYMEAGVLSDFIMVLAGILYELLGSNRVYNLWVTVNPFLYDWMKVKLNLHGFANNYGNAVPQNLTKLLCDVSQYDFADR